MQTAAQVIALTALLFLAQELLRNCGKWVLWGLFLAAPAVLTPYWIAVNEFDPFLWIKCYSVFFCMGWGSALRFTRLGELPWARRTIPLLLAANILEATAVDLLEPGSAHTLNAIAGLILIATLPYGLQSTRVDESSTCRDLRYRCRFGWICGYTAWNWVFVYLNYPALTAHHTAVLASALIVAMIDPQRWLQSRTCTLGLNLLTMATVNSGMVSWLDTTSWYEEVWGLLAAGIALGVVASCLIEAPVWRRHAAKRLGEMS